MTDDKQLTLPDDLKRAAPGVYVAETMTDHVWLHPKEILAARNQEPEPALVGSLVTKLVAMYAEDGIKAVIIDDE